MEYQKFKMAAEHLKEKESWNALFWDRPVSPDAEAEREEMVEANLYDLVHAFAILLKRTQKREALAIEPDQFSVQQKIQELTEFLEKNESFSLMEYAKRLQERVEAIVLFLAILEMIRLNLLRIFKGERSANSEVGNPPNPQIHIGCFRNGNSGLKTGISFMMKWQAIIFDAMNSFHSLPVICGVQLQSRPFVAAQPTRNGSPTFGPAEADVMASMLSEDGDHKQSAIRYLDYYEAPFEIALFRIHDLLRDATKLV
jgi:hypothetical protein